MLDKGGVLTYYCITYNTMYALVCVCVGTHYQYEILGKKFSYYSIYS